MYDDAEIIENQRFVNTYAIGYCMMKATTNPRNHTPDGNISYKTV